MRPREIDHEQATVIPLRFAGVNGRLQIAVHAGDGRFAEHPAGELDTMAAHVQHHATAAPGHIPKPGSMGTIVLLRLLDEIDGAQRTLIDQLLEPDILGSKAQFLGIHQLHTGSIARGDHAIALLETGRHRLFNDDVFAGGGGRLRRFTMEVVWQAEHDQVDLLHLQHRSVIDKPMGNPPLLGELAHVRLCGRRHGHHFRRGNLPQRIEVDARDELRTDKTDTHLGHGRASFSVARMIHRFTG